MAQTHRILIINPNTTTAMTDALKPLVESLGYTETSYTFFTAPSGVPSINNEADGTVSTDASLPALREMLTDHDAFLVCCYSPHPLVPALRQTLQARGEYRKLVTGIFEASVAACLQLLSPAQGGKFGIVSTGAQWSAILDKAVADLLATSLSSSGCRYVGTETTGLNADELHVAPKADVEERMREATRRVLRRGARGVCLGCAGMVGLEEVVREAAVEELGKEGWGVRVVDGVAAGVGFVVGALRAGL